jgi:sugar phosphate isomerase/epimerase
MKVGISSFSYGWSVGVAGSQPNHPLDAMGLVREAERLGVSLVQIGDNLPLHSLPEAQLEELKGDCFRKGIALEVGCRGFLPEMIMAYIVIASQLASPILRIVTDTDDCKPSTAEIVAVVRELVPELERHEVTLAIENHDRFRAEELVRMIKAVDSERIGICLDTVNSFGCGEGVESVVQCLAPYTNNLHLMDFTIARFPHQMGFTVSGTPLGKGMLNVPWLLAVLKAHGRDVNAVIELWTPPEKEIEVTMAKERRWVEESVTYLRRLITD